MKHPDPTFWRGKRVLLTGHTGFKGAWAALYLHHLGAKVTGFALPSPGAGSAYDEMRVNACCRSVIGDIRNRNQVDDVLGTSRPDIVLHLAAQALVGVGYRDPAMTFEVNTGGVVTLLDALARMGGAAATLVVTTDKVYRNDGLGRAFCETDELGGADPYSASKAAAEHVVTAFIAARGRVSGPLATARAGNVLGGGDVSAERLIPDLIRAETEGEPIMLRNANATRPFQSVRDVIRGYLLQVEHLAIYRQDSPRAINFGPTEQAIRVCDLLEAYGAARNRPVVWHPVALRTYTEAPRLGLDSTLAANVLGWKPAHTTATLLAETASWQETLLTGGNVIELARSWIAEDIEALATSVA